MTYVLIGHKKKCGLFEIKVISLCKLQVLATGLKPSTKYYYQVSNGKSDGKWQTAVEYFITGPEKGTSDTVYSIVFGDIGISMPFTTIVADQKLNFSNYGKFDLPIDACI